jgi:hypothetical protein
MSYMLEDKLDKDIQYLKDLLHVKKVEINLLEAHSAALRLPSLRCVCLHVN